MKAILTTGKGLDSMRIGDMPELGAPGPGMALVQAKAFSLNYRDLMVVEGRYGRPLEREQICGSDMSGVVLEVGPGVEHIKPGDKVLNAPITAWKAGGYEKEYARTFLGGGGVDGIFAEQVILPAQALVPFERLNFAQAATLPVAGLTAWAAVVTHGRLEPGGSILCLGTGGVSIFAAQLAHAIGAQVFITSSSEEKLTRCQQLIHDHISVINYAENPEWPKGIMDVTDGDGVDVVVETVGGASLQKSIDSLAFHGRVCLIGILDSVQANVSVVKILVRQAHLIGIYMESIAELRKLTSFLDNGHLRPVIGRHFEFDEAKAAYQYLKSQKHFGKIVLEV